MIIKLSTMLSRNIYYGDQRFQCDLLKFIKYHYLNHLILIRYENTPLLMNVKVGIDASVDFQFQSAQKVNILGDFQQQHSLNKNKKLTLCNKHKKKNYLNFEFLNEHFY